MRVGDLVKHNKPSTRAEFDATGLVIEVREDWMRNWSRVRVLWHGETAAEWHTLGTLKVLTSS